LNTSLCTHLLITLQQPFVLTQTATNEAAYLCTQCAVENIETLLAAGWRSGDVARTIFFDRCGHFDAPKGRCGKCFSALWSLLNYVCIRNKMTQRGKLHSALNKILKHLEEMHGRVHSNSAYLYAPHVKDKDQVRCLHK
jgi:hypothetical protein